MAKEENLGEIFVKIKADVTALEKEVDRLKGQMKKDAEKMGTSFADTFKKGLKLAGGLIGLKAAFDFGKKIVNTASEFEQLQTRLVSLYGSVDKATDVFAKFKKIAATTPFSLKNVVQAGATLKAFGMDAENTLKSVTDLAAFMGLDVVEAAQAVGRAFAGGVGAADVLRERGVLNLIKSFKGIEDLTKLTLPEFRKALIEAMQDPAAGIAGATDRMSQTFAGAMSNMGDALENLAAKIGTVFLPALKRITKTITALVSPSQTLYEQWKEQSEKVGELQRKIPGLLEKYDKLLPLSKDNADKQRELQKVINEIATLMPTAVTQWDKYGKALGISKGKVKELLDAEKEYLKFKNREAIKEISEELKKLKKEHAEAERVLNQGYVIKPSNPATNVPGTSFDMKISINYDEWREKVNKLQRDIDAKRRLLKILSGEFDFGDDENDSKGAGDSVNKTIKAAENSIESLKQKIKDLQDRLVKLDPNSTLFFVVARQIGELEKALDDAYTKLEAFKGGVGSIEDIRQTITTIEEKKIEVPKTVSEVNVPDITPQIDEQIERLSEYYELLENPPEFGFVDAAKTSMSMAQGFVSGFFDDLYIRAEWANSMLEKAFVGMANAFIAEVERMISKWLAFQALRLTFGALGIPIPGGATGGTFIGTSKGVKKAATGASFVVPAGFPNDSYPMRVQTGERVDVTPANKVGELHKSLSGIYNSIKVLNENIIDMMLARPKSQTQRVLVEGEIGNDAIYLSNRKQEKLRARYGG